MSTVEAEDRADTVEESEDEGGCCGGGSGSGGGWRCRMESIRRSKRILVASVFLVLMFDSILLTAVGKQAESPMNSFIEKCRSWLVNDAYAEPNMIIMGRIVSSGQKWGTVLQCNW